MYRKNFQLLTLIILVAVAGVMPVRAQELSAFDSMMVRMPSMHIPSYDITKKKRFIASAGISMVKPPKDMVETSVHAPLFNLHANYTLPLKLSLEGDFTTLIVSSQFSLGPRLGYTLDRVGLKLGWDLAFVAGRMKEFGFNNTHQAWIHYPNISGSYQLRKMVLSLKAEIITVASVSTRTGENELTHTKDFYNGNSVAFYIEQRIHENRVFIIGFKDSYVKYYWPTWMTFPTFKRLYHIPELTFSWILK